jgi:hypothetical protein
VEGEEMSNSKPIAKHLIEQGEDYLANFLDTMNNEGEKMVTSINALEAENKTLREAAKEYMDYSSFISNGDGSCMGCWTEEDDPESHPDWCRYGIAGKKLAKLLKETK